jgi:hypothetical protein
MSFYHWSWSCYVLYTLLCICQHPKFIFVDLIHTHIYRKQLVFIVEVRWKIPIDNLLGRIHELSHQHKKDSKGRNQENKLGKIPDRTKEKKQP